jgi:hypothetical protein
MAVNLEQIVDGGRDPNAKARLVSGRLNMFTCQACGFQSRLATPMLYHDQGKEMLIIYVPMELGLPQAEQERLIGSMTQAIVNSIPQNQRKGYLFIPKQALTMQGLIEMVLEGDGVTKEMLDARRQKVRLIESFLQTDPDQWEQMAKDNDSHLDREFFEVITASADAAVANGRRDVAENLLALRESLLQASTVGQELIEGASKQEAAIQEVAVALNALGDHVTLEDVATIAIEIGGRGDDRLQALVGLARPVLTYEFFDMLTKRADAADQDQAAHIISIRDRLLDLINVLDQTNQQVVEQAVNTLREIMMSSDVEAAIQARLGQIDDLFIQVLSANIQHAEQQQNLVQAARLKDVYTKIMALMEQSAPPAVKFINDLLQMPTDQMRKQEIALRASEFGPDLLTWIDTLIESLDAQGGDPGMRDILADLRGVAERSLQLGDSPGGGQPASGRPGPGASLLRFDGRRGAAEPDAPPSPPPPPATDRGDSTGLGIVLPFSARKRKDKS